MDFSDFLEKLVDNYNEEELNLIKKSLIFANNKHMGQFRKSGEPYIIHPIAVASMLIDLKADVNTICAALLHDVIEDTLTTKEEIISEFNEDIANLVDGVTKIQINDNISKEERKSQYIRKVTTSIFEDVRIIIIKLMDRVHNMMTLSYQSENKQKRIAKETLEIYVPLAYYLGIYKIRFLLEDLSFKYLYPKTYKVIEHERENIIEDGNILLDDMIENIKSEIGKYNIDVVFEKSTKNIYGIFKRIRNGSSIYDVSDILRIKVIVPNVIDCYKLLGIIHSLYHPLHNKFKDYISTPKTNKYQSIHTTVYTNINHLVQFQIRTKEMNEINQYGIITAWKKGIKSKDITNYLCNNFPFISILKDINENYKSDLAFMNKLEHDILKEKVYVTIGNGNILEMPSGSTLQDLCDQLGVSYTRLMVNNEVKNTDYVLKSNDFISFVKSKVKK